MAGVGGGATVADHVDGRLALIGIVERLDQLFDVGFVDRIESALRVVLVLTEIHHDITSSYIVLC